MPEETAKVLMQKYFEDYSFVRSDIESFNNFVKFELQKIIEENRDMIVDLAKLETLDIQEPGEKPGASATTVIDGATIFVSLAGIIDFDKESARLQKEIDKLSKELTGINKKLSNESFLSKAPADIVEKVKEKQ